MKKLPIGIQTLSEIINNGYAYVDKTAIAYRLIEQGKYYFLSRPRRFGKSLFLDTLKQIFLGNERLFKGLAIEKSWDFNQKFPVIHISLGSGFQGEERDIKAQLRFALRRAERELGYTVATKDAVYCLQELIWYAYDKFQENVVILIDEYDKPILDNLTNTLQAKKARDILKAFYAILKDNDAYIRFLFLTGVSKFSKMNLFSGLNSLNDITLDKQYGTICGYTHQDLQDTFGTYLENADMEAVKEWYNGYNYFGEKVYNPFDILLFIDKGLEFKNYWWSTGNPQFLVDMIQARPYQVPDLENCEVTDTILDSFEVDAIELEALLWQTGYLTIKEKFTERQRIKYRLTIPNKEIQFSLNDFFIDTLTQQKSEKNKFQDSLYATLQAGNIEGLQQTLIALFASIPYHNFTNNQIANYEGYYASVLYAYFASLGFSIIAEDFTNKGRIDLTLRLSNKTYIFEFKVVEQTTQQALQQIKTKQYYQKYQAANTEVYLIGIEFGNTERNIIHWEIEVV